MAKEINVKKTIKKAKDFENRLNNPVALIEDPKLGAAQVYVLVDLKKALMSGDCTDKQENEIEALIGRALSRTSNVKQN